MLWSTLLFQKRPEVQALDLMDLQDCSESLDPDSLRSPSFQVGLDSYLKSTRFRCLRNSDKIHPTSRPVTFWTLMTWMWRLREACLTLMTFCSTLSLTPKSSQNSPSLKMFPFLARNNWLTILTLKTLTLIMT